MSERLDRIEKILEENSKGLQQLRVSQAKTDEQLNKLKESQAKTDEKLYKLATSQAKTDEQLKKTDEQLNRLEKSHGKLSKEIRNFIGNYGQTVEEYFFHSLEYSMKLGKIKFNSIRKNVKGMLTEHEYDIILANGDCIGVIEVKSKLHFEDVATLKKTFHNIKDSNITLL